MDLRIPSVDEIAANWHAFAGGPPVVGELDTYQPGDVDGLLAEDGSTGSRACITWAIRGASAELVSVHADPPGTGAGSRLLAIVEERLAAAGVRRVVVATTNDNLPAVAFYQRCGYRLTAIRLDHMDRVRRHKPQVPAHGIDGLPLRDLWVFAKAL